MTRAYKERDSSQITLRLSDGVLRELKVIAAKNGRSVNSEINLIIEQSMISFSPTETHSEYPPPSMEPKEMRPDVRQSKPPTFELSLRDRFAGQAMQGLVSGSSPLNDFDFHLKSGLSIIENYAHFSYQFADAMLKARKA